MRYRKKPVEVEAFRWTGGQDQTEDPAWFVEAFKAGVVSVRCPYLYIDTLEGTHTANPGDYIIRGVKGELYPCKPDIFRATYEPVDDLESFSCATCRELFAGVPCNDQGECTRCAGFDHGCGE